jgi:hypothetical protein
MHANDPQGADMRLANLAFVTLPAGREGTTLRGAGRLLRDLFCVGQMLEERPSAAERVEAILGPELAGVAHAAVMGPGPVHGVRPRRAA